MESCAHVKQVRLGVDRSFLNPRAWTCTVCGTTDSVWACLLCSHMGCGRDSCGHALQHFDSTKHPISIEINRGYVHCYMCDEYILNDNPQCDLELIRSLLLQVSSQRYHESRTRSGKVIKPSVVLNRSESRLEQTISHAADKKSTALSHWRSVLLAKVFSAWHICAADSKKTAAPPTTSVPPIPPPPPSLPPLPSPSKRKRPLVPGMTGIRNLGNTCYMNAVLQSLGHVAYLRECFRNLVSASTDSTALFNRQTTIECFQHITTKPPALSSVGRLQRCQGLNGGAEGSTTGCRRSSRSSVTDDEPPSLAQEVHRLMRVMWSGKWSVVTPHTVLDAVWRLVPLFHGYTQQDAQEFLCEILQQLQVEMERYPSGHLIFVTSYNTIAIPREVLPALFQGRLCSQVTYTTCLHSSSVEEPFWDLSLQLPERCCSSQSRHVTSNNSCTLEELLQLFTASEELEGNIYTCAQCAGPNCSTAQSSSDAVQLQGARKKLAISDPPDVLRLHLKRFSWNGQKINTHISFPLSLDLSSFCKREGGVSLRSAPEDTSYQLSSVIIHHGNGFNCGHYTSICWNSEADSWVHCNDAKVSRCTQDEVLASQAYILFYVRGHGVSSPIVHTAGPQESGPETPSAKRVRFA
eukprot:Em0021g808a